MPNRSPDILFQLIHALEKSEKRNFKLYVTRSSSNHDLKIIQLFDAIDKLQHYDEVLLLKKLSSIQKPQIANLKAHLYKQILASLRLLKSTDSIDMQLHEQLDYSRILYNKGLYIQSLKMLEKVKEVAKAYDQHSFLIQAISLEKKIETLHITRSMQNRADVLSEEATQVNEKRRNITRLSNLAMLLYSWYIKNGHARNEADEALLNDFFYTALDKAKGKTLSFYEKMYIYQSYAWSAFIRQDFLMYYRYTQKWVNLFEDEPKMIEVEAGHYIKGIHNLLNANFDLKNYRRYDEILNQFEAFSKSDIAAQNENIRLQTFVYLNSAKLNRHLSIGSFKEGLAMVPVLDLQLMQYELFLDPHRVLVFNYKIATLYFGAGNYEVCIDYLRKIINDNLGLRNDLQCYARLLHLIAHYELGNIEIIESLIKSVYRFMAKMQNLTVVEEEMFKFLKHSFYISPRRLQPEFLVFLNKIKHLETSRFETRAYAYLDIISWVESKVHDKPVAEIIHEKYNKSKRRSSV